ncbi:epsin-2 isoform X2 [Xenopus laevis]|uniref:Epsin-2 isoform X2 n=1 Tax=Xenopus laevis TaxID=8355 RepID=A0A8J1LX46_XENLA|nr:epsin-2 isoform X2 [Xenopus laevis]
MTTSSIRRQMKNIVNNYSEAEIKVREATSNDPWGPSSSLMTEVADLTYNVVAFSEIMSMIWKRLNDHGKNWRHVYKALTLLDYLIKTGSERVSHQCKENIFAIQTLKDFQYIDRDGKDQGINVREKSKQLVCLLKDDERLKGERAQALKTKERMAQVATGVSSNNQISFGRGSSQPNLSTSYSEQDYGKSGGSPASYHGSTSPAVSAELEQARPQTSGEEELQLQLALAMSREVAEQDERVRRGDDLRLQMALEESRKDTIKVPRKKGKQQSTMLDLLDALPPGAPAPRKPDTWAAAVATKSQSDSWNVAAVSPSSSDPWQSFGSGTKPAAPQDPWGGKSGSSTQSLSKNSDPWTTPKASQIVNSATDPWGAKPAVKTSVSITGLAFDPFSNLNGTTKDDLSEFDSLRTSSKVSADSISTLPSLRSNTTSPDPFDSKPASVTSSKQTSFRKTPETFLGSNAALVNLDTLVSMPPPPAPILNPFLASGAAATTSTPPVNPFQVNQPQALTLNQLRVSPMMGVSPVFNTIPGVGAEPLFSVPPPSPPGLGMSTLPAAHPAGLGVNINMAATLPHYSTAMAPSSTQAVNATNPFLL